MPGQLIKVHEIIVKMIEDIETRNQRKGVWAEAQQRTALRNGRNHYINIVEYF